MSLELKRLKGISKIHSSTPLHEFKHKNFKASELINQGAEFFQGCPMRNFTGPCVTCKNSSQNY